LCSAGEGRSFCIGHDRTAIADHESAPSRRFEPETVIMLEVLSIPTTARIRGHCYTGGLALASDILVGGVSARLGDTHGQLGLVPIWGVSVRLPERVGRSTAKELMYTSRRIDATMAADIGLVDHVVPDDDLDKAIDGLASEIAVNSPGLIGSSRRRSSITTSGVEALRLRPIVRCYVAVRLT